MLDWINKTWDRFESWIVDLWPGVHTKLLAIAGVIYSFAVVLQEYVEGLHLEQFITPATLAIVNLVLFSLIFWLRNVNNRVIARELEATGEDIKERTPIKAKSLKKASKLIRDNKVLEATNVVKIETLAQSSEAVKKEVEAK